MYSLIIKRCYLFEIRLLSLESVEIAPAPHWPCEQHSFWLSRTTWKKSARALEWAEPSWILSFWNANQAISARIKTGKSIEFDAGPNSCHYKLEGEVPRSLSFLNPIHPNDSTPFEEYYRWLPIKLSGKVGSRKENVQWNPRSWLRPLQNSTLEKKHPLTGNLSFHLRMNGATNCYLAVYASDGGKEKD